MRTTFKIETGLLDEARIRARQRRTTLGEVLNEALRVGLLGANPKQPGQSSAPLKTFRGKGLQTGVDLRDSAALREIMEQP